MSCVRFLNYNLVDSEIYANRTVSSEQSSFPIDNIESKIRRSKVWRSNGYFNVTSSNNTLIFRDASGGPDIEATISEGEYTSISSFMTAVETALDAVGAANYTVSQNSFLKFVISSDLSGGATAFELRMADALNTCEGLLGFDSTNLSGSSSYISDYLRINTEEWILIDAGTPISVNSFALTGPRNRALKLSPNGTFTLQGSYTDAWNSPAFSQTIDYDDETLTLLDDTGFYSEPLRYWRFKFQDQNASGYIEVGSLFIGTYYAPERGRAQFPFSSTLEDNSTISYSEGGQSFSNIQEQTQSFHITWNALTKDEVEDLMLIYQEYGKAYPFFMSFDSSAVFSSSNNRLVKYVKFTSDPDYTLVAPNNFEMTMQFREEL